MAVRDSDSAQVRAVPARIGRVVLKRPCCGGCVHFKRQDATGHFIGGGPAHGRCDAPTMSKQPEEWRPWRRDSDWCDRFEAPKPAGSFA